MTGSACEQDDHDSVWQAGREAGYRDALIALAEHGGQFIEALDRDIADSLKRDREYVAAHDAAVLRERNDTHPYTCGQPAECPEGHETDCSARVDIRPGADS